MSIHKKFQKILFITTILALSSCATSSTTTESTDPYNPTFDYNPPNNSQEKIDIVIGLLNPSYALDSSNGSYMNIPQDRAYAMKLNQTHYQFLLSQDNLGMEFQQAMTNDFEEALNARGFLLKGPFENYDNMVYSDRQDSDLILKAQLDLLPEVTSFDVGEEFLLLNPNRDYNYYISRGTASLSGRISLTIYESMTQTKLWTRSIPVSNRTFSFQGELKYAAPPQGVSLREVQFKNGLAREMEKIYSDLFQTVWNFLDPKEMQQLKKQALEIREKSGFEIKQ